ncbi:glycoside hydrolase family 88/105 protein [Paenibacillus ginsengihumi]|uniref:glycoside hydrolase family 88/105 protein n=1 Tax=Paenibacillus ginsengihumi TaxID=431596 RepID=UPI000377C75F|nr:glycoside hydrolase family 88 protein [Paenibacillus ginsengihumi]
MKEQVQLALRKVMDQLLHLKRPQNEDRWQALGENGKTQGYFPRDFGMEEWDWPQGVGLYGLRKLAEHSRDPQRNYDDFIVRWAKEQMRRGLPLKNINTTAPMLTLMDYSEFKGLSLEWMEWLVNECPRTAENGFQHVTSGDTKQELTLHDQEIWIDTLFMVVLFAAKMGVRHNNPAWLSEADAQFALHIKYLFNRDDALFYHGYDFKNKHNFSQAYWCRGNSWFTLAVPEYFDMTQREAPTRSYGLIFETYRAQVDKLMSLQAKNGLWHTLLDDPDSYTEVSGSAAIAAGILKGIRLGLLDARYADGCFKTIEAVMSNIAEDGTVMNVSAGTAIGKRKEDYKSIMLAPTTYGQSLTIVLLAEALNHLAG